MARLKKHITARIPESQYDELKYFSDKMDITKSDLIMQALGTLFGYLREEEKKHERYLKESEAEYVTNGVAQDKQS